MLGWLANERAIEPYIAVFDKSARDDGTFSRADFNDDQEADIYIVQPGCKFALTSASGLFGCAAAVLRCPQAGVNRPKSAAPESRPLTLNCLQKGR
jgi:hypothetical protein